MKKLNKICTFVCVLLSATMLMQAQLPGTSSSYSTLESSGGLSGVSKSVYGESVTFTATVEGIFVSTGTSIRPTGKVMFECDGVEMADSVELIPQPLSGTNPPYSIATLTTTILSVGNRSIVVNYGGDATYNGSSSGTGFIHTVNKANTAVEFIDITLESDMKTLKGTVEVTAKDPGSGTPGGRVYFYLNSSTTSFGNSTLNTSGRANFSATHTFVPGDFVILARYEGNTNYLDSRQDSTIKVTGKPKFDPPAVIEKSYGDPVFALPDVSGGFPDGGPYRYRSDRPAVAAVDSVTGRVTVVSLGEANMYVWQSAYGIYPKSPESDPVKVVVSRKTLTVTGITASKQYDGTNTFTNAQIDISKAVINGIVGNETVTLSKTGVTGGTFGPDLGTGTLRYTGSFSITGPDVANYTLQQPTVSASIFARSDVSITDITVDGISATRSGNSFSITAPCGANSVNINVSADLFTTVTINSVQQNPRRVDLPDYGENIINIVVTAQNGDSQTYTLAVDRFVPVDVAFFDRFADVLTVPLHVAGIAEAINSVEWYFNDARLDRDPAKGYLEMKAAGDYYAILNNKYRTCDFTKTDTRSAMAMTVFPNPVDRNQSISIEIDNPDGIDLRDAQLQLHGLDGRLLQTVPVTDSNMTINAPAYSGMVVVKLIYKSGNEEVKLIIK